MRSCTLCPVILPTKALARFFLTEVNKMEAEGLSSIFCRSLGQQEDFEFPQPLSRFSKDSPAHQLLPCTHCLRTFLPDRIQKHQTVCVASQRKRPIYTITPPIFLHVQSESQISIKKKKQAISNKYSNMPWHKKHNDLLINLRSEGGKPLSLYDTFTQCPHCFRTFSPKVSERHIANCKIAINKPRVPRARPSPNQRTKKSVHNSIALLNEFIECPECSERIPQKDFALHLTLCRGRESPPTSNFILRRRSAFDLTSNKSCKSCSTVLPMNSRFCSSCGRKLDK